MDKVVGYAAFCVCVCQCILTLRSLYPILCRALHSKGCSAVRNATDAKCEVFEVERDLKIICVFVQRDTTITMSRSS